MKINRNFDKQEVDIFDAFIQKYINFKLNITQEQEVIETTQSNLHVVIVNVN